MRGPQEVARRSVAGLPAQDLLEEVAARRIDAVFSDPYLAINIMNRDRRARPLVSYVRRENGREIDASGGLVLVRADEPGEAGLRTLRGKTVAIPGRYDLGGYLAPGLELHRVDPELLDSIRWL